MSNVHVQAFEIAENINNVFPEKDDQTDCEDRPNTVRRFTRAT